MYVKMCTTVFIALYRPAKYIFTPLDRYINTNCVWVIWQSLRGKLSVDTLKVSLLINNSFTFTCILIFAVGGTVELERMAIRAIEEQLMQEETVGVHNPSTVTTRPTIASPLNITPSSQVLSRVSGVLL